MNRDYRRFIHVLIYERQNAVADRDGIPMEPRRWRRLRSAALWHSNCYDYRPECQNDKQATLMFEAMMLSKIAQEVEVEMTVTA